MKISSTNSKTNPNSRRKFTPMPYIVFELKNGKMKMFNVLYFSKK